MIYIYIESIECYHFCSAPYRQKTRKFDYHPPRRPSADAIPLILDTETFTVGSRRSLLRILCNDTGCFLSLWDWNVLEMSFFFIDFEIRLVIKRILWWRKWVIYDCIILSFFYWDYEIVSVLLGYLDIFKVFKNCICLSISLFF